MLRSIRAPLQAVACCFAPPPEPATGERLDATKRVAGREQAKAAALTPPKPVPLPKPPRGWPWASEAAQLRHLEACGRHSPALLLAALHECGAMHQYPAMNERVRDGALALLSQCEKAHGLERVQDALRAWSNTLSEFNRDKDSRLLQLVHAAIPAALPPLLTPEAFKLLHRAPVEALEARWRGLQPDVTLAKDWALALHVVPRMEAWRAFIACSAAPAWQAHQPHMALYLPRKVWALLIGPAASDGDLQGWAPREPEQRRPFDARDVAAFTREEDPDLRAYMEALPPGPADADLLKAAAEVLGGDPVWRLRWALDRGLDAAHCFPVNCEQLRAAAVHADATALLPLLLRVPADAELPIRHLWRCVEEGIALPELLAFAHWLQQRSAETFGHWAPMALDRLRELPASTPISETQRHQLAQLAAATGSPATRAEAARLPLVRQQLPELRKLLAGGARTFERACRALAVPPGQAALWQTAAAQTPERAGDDEALWTDRMELALALSPLATAEVQSAVAAFESSAATPWGDVARFAAQTVADGQSDGCPSPPGEAGVAPATLPPSLPRLALHRVATLASQAQDPRIASALLAALQPHLARLRPCMLPLCALTAHRVHADPWPWLVLLATRSWQSGREVLFRTLLPIDSKPPPCIEHWVGSNLGRAPQDTLRPLTRWLARDTNASIDPSGLLEHDLLATLTPSADLRTDLAVLYARVRDPDEVAVRCEVLALLPEDAWHRAARAWARRGHMLETPTGLPPVLEALSDCLKLEAPSDAACAAFPELGLVRSGMEGWPQLLKAPSTPAWLRAIAGAEPSPDNDPDAAFAQRNRMEALSRYLLACRATALSPAQQAAQAPTVRQLLALPDAGLRHALLMRLAGASAEEQVRVLRLQNTVRPARALPLQLCAHLYLPEEAALPAVQAVLQARAVSKEGTRARGLMHFMRATGHEEQLYVRQTLGWATLTNLLQMLSSARTAPELQAAAEQARGVQQGTVEAATLRKAAHGLDLLAAARAAVNAAMGPDNPWERAPQPLLDALDEALGALREVPALAAVLKRAERLATPEALLQRRTHEDLRAVRGALSRQPVAKRDAWMLFWGDALLHTLQSHVVPPARIQVPAGSEAFFAQPAIQALVQERVAPLVLALQQYASLVQKAERWPHSFTQASEVLPAVMQWTGMSDEENARLADTPYSHYVAAYVANMARWSPAEEAAGQALVRDLLQARLAGTVDALRRRGPQAQRILQGPGGHALMDAWERGAEGPANLAGTQGWTFQDSGDAGTLLAAVTQVSSCQAVEVTSTNGGMLGRLSDGGKRMLLLRDARGQIRGRATLRLMQTPKRQPALLMSPVYVDDRLVDRETMRSAAEQFVRQRAGALGIAAVVSHPGGLPAPVGAVRYKQPLLATGGALDYWDEEGKRLTRERVRLTKHLYHAAG